LFAGIILIFLIREKGHHCECHLSLIFKEYAAKYCIVLI
jgi:hypothetical protein